MKRTYKVRMLSSMLAVALVVALACSSAFAVSEPYLDVNYYNDPDTQQAQFINEASVKLSWNCVLLQVDMYVYEEYNEDNVICDQSKYKEYPVGEWISTSWTSYTLRNGDYVNEGRAYAKYGIDETLYYSEKERVFTHNRTVASYNMDDMDSQECSGVDRGIAIAAEFGNVPDDYEVYYNSEIESKLDPDPARSSYNYSLIRHQLYLCYGDRIPTYFLSPDGNTLIAVKQDADGNNYSFTFERRNSGEWELVGDALMLENEGTVTSMAAEEHPVAAKADGSTFITGADLCAHLDSVETYLSIRKLLDGGQIIAYCMGPDGTSLTAIREEEDGARSEYTLIQNEDGHWEAPS